MSGDLVESEHVEPERVGSGQAESVQAESVQAEPGWTARALGLADLLDAEAAHAEELRQLTPAVLDAARRSGLFTMVVPERWGGEGRGLTELIETTRIMATGCPASAWTLSFLLMHNWLVTRFPEELQVEVLGSGQGYGLVPAPLAPTGRLRAVTGAGGESGWEVTGRWEWATGVRHADWVMVTGLEDRDDALVARFAVLPISDVVVDDVWHTSGMRATGSDDVRVEGVFVPEHRTLPADELLESGPVTVGDGLAHLPVMAVLALLAAAPAVGAAERAVAEYESRLRSRVLAYSFGDKAAEQPAAQVRLGTALADVRAARAALDGGVALLEEIVTSADPMADRMAVRLAAADAVRRSVAVISDVCAGAGASVYRAKAPLQRLQRDVEVLKGHVVFDWDRTTELAGRVALGLPLRPADRL
ncbi:MAG: acyl-CoA dehydrogenase [Actinobacteria bacterium]|nr:acyl-CoA dehydrogenase [Actinomycetota bacterium]